MKRTISVLKQSAGKRSLSCLAALLIFSAIQNSIAAPPPPEAPVLVRLGTLAPTGSSYHQALLEMGEKWRESTSGNIKLVIFPDGRQGGEADMVRKMRAGQINAGMLTAVGLSEIDRAIACLQYMPMMFASWEDVDYVREKLSAQLEKKLLDKGFVVLCWGDAGWVHFFSKVPVLRPGDFKRLKIFAWAGDTYQVDLMKALGYQPIALEVADILPGLQTGLIDAAAFTPYFALAGQCDGPAPHMLDMNWVPIVGATVIKKEVYEKFPSQALDAIRKASSTAGEKLRARSRLENEEAVTAMRKRGLKVTAITAEIESEWRQLAESVYPQIRGKMVPADMFDEVRRLLAEKRANRQEPKK